jgi:hypothetical protein
MMSDSTHVINVSMREQNGVISDRLTMPSPNIKTHAPTGQLDTRLQTGDGDRSDGYAGKVKCIAHLFDSVPTHLIIEDPGDHFSNLQRCPHVGLNGGCSRSGSAEIPTGFHHGRKPLLPSFHVARPEINPAFFGPLIQIGALGDFH